MDSLQTLMRKRMRLIAAGILALVVAAGTGAFFLLRPSGFERTDPMGYQACRVLADSNGSSNFTVEFGGLLEAAKSAQLAESADVVAAVDTTTVMPVADRGGLTSACRAHGVDVPDPVAVNPGS